MTYKDEALTAAILKAFEQIGDETALPDVERLAAHGRTKAIHDAAWGCLPFLKARAKQALQAQTLLRAVASSDVIPSDTLLRPAQGGAPTDASLLLRPQPGPRSQEIRPT